MADHFNVMGTPLILVTDNSARLNSKLELDERGVILHSRSGKQRNRDYRLALELLLARLDGAGIRYSIYLDSKPVQDIPLDERLLHFDQQASISARFDELVRAMNKGSASHGAWRRLLIQIPKMDRDILLLAIGAIDDTADDDRLPAALLRRVTVAHIHYAVAKLLDGKDASNFALSREYDALTDDGVALAPKKILASPWKRHSASKLIPSTSARDGERPALSCSIRPGFGLFQKAIPPPVPNLILRKSIEESPVCHRQRKNKPGLREIQRSSNI
ncbi:hypothetical protein HB779_07000 [Phyllobacterium sp. 628]|uniref:hypothetical protein n=1 Tax=Phyllobacterium sp. 628 TaxID=2718938 RepID=UPI001662286A|nr:hypothetical protein [Phyllobacterium sp. 628]QND51675.1 hypothetical protein HB779_07000 [Phyllobacterium sp. 628]